MALEDFWMSVRRAAGPIAPQPVVDSPKLDPTEIERTLRGSTLWLTPRAVAGCDVKDFEFLPDAERERLAELVKDFRTLVPRLYSREPVPEDVVERALPLFRDIILFLEFNRYGDPEAYRLGKQIEREIAAAQWPPELAELRFNTRLDHAGDPGIWIWGFLTEEASATDDLFLENASWLSDWIDPIARDVAPDRFPYISFRSIAEEVDLADAS
jgi:hypothetical protein